MPSARLHMGSRDQWEFPPFFRPQLQSFCTALTAGKWLPLGLCKGTVKESNLFIVKTPTQRKIGTWLFYTSCSRHNKSHGDTSSMNTCKSINIQFCKLYELTVYIHWFGVTKARLAFQKQVSGARISNYIPEILWDVIVYPGCLLVAQAQAHTLTFLYEVQYKPSCCICRTFE